MEEKIFCACWQACWAGWLAPVAKRVLGFEILQLPSGLSVAGD